MRPRHGRAIRTSRRRRGPLRAGRSAWEPATTARADLGRRGCRRRKRASRTGLQTPGRRSNWERRPGPRWRAGPRSDGTGRATEHQRDGEHRCAKGRHGGDATHASAPSNFRVTTAARTEHQRPCQRRPRWPTHEQGRRACQLRRALRGPGDRQISQRGPIESSHGPGGCLMLKVWQGNWRRDRSRL